MSVKSIFLRVPLGEALTCSFRLTDTEETAREAELRRDLSLCKCSGATVTTPSSPHPAQCTQGTASGFFSLLQAALIFHTTGNWTLSSVIELLGARSLSLYWKMKAVAVFIGRNTEFCCGPPAPANLLLKCKTAQKSIVSQNNESKMINRKKYVCVSENRPL